MLQAIKANDGHLSTIATVAKLKLPSDMAQSKREKRERERERGNGRERGRGKRSRRHCFDTSTGAKGGEK